MPKVRTRSTTAGLASATAIWATAPVLRAARTSEEPISPQPITAIFWNTGWLMTLLPPMNVGQGLDHGRGCWSSRPALMRMRFGHAVADQGADQPALGGQEVFGVERRATRRFRKADDHEVGRRGGYLQAQPADLLGQPGPPALDQLLTERRWNSSSPRAAMAAAWAAIEVDVERPGGSG